jgi:hypothetical protein
MVCKVQTPISMRAERKFGQQRADLVISPTLHVLPLVILSTSTECEIVAAGYVESDQHGIALQD